MGFREKLQNPAVGYSVAGAIVLVAIVIFMTSGEKAAARITRVWFYDEDTKTRFAAPDTALPPVATPDGGQNGVRAIVFGCGDCADPFIGYLQTYPPEVAASHREAVAALGDTKAPALEPGRSEPLGIDLSKGLLVRAEDGEWFEASDSDRYGALMSAVNTRCGTKRPQQCYP